MDQLPFSSTHHKETFGWGVGGVKGGEWGDG